MQQKRDSQLHVANGDVSDSDSRPSLSNVSIHKDVVTKHFYNPRDRACENGQSQSEAPHKIDYNEKKGIMDASWIISQNELQETDPNHPTYVRERVPLNLNRVVNSIIKSLQSRSVDGALITSLFLDHNHCLTECVPPNLVPNLVKLDLSGNDLTRVCLYPKLILLNLSHNVISDISMYDGHPNLVSFDCSHNRLSTSKLVLGLNKCKYLDLNSCFGVDTKARAIDLSRCKMLRACNLGNTGIHDIACLKKCKNLKSLTLPRNKLSGTFFLNNWPCLQECDLSYNRGITELSPSYSVRVLIAKSCGINNISAPFAKGVGDRERSTSQAGTDGQVGAQYPLVRILHLDSNDLTQLHFSKDHLYLQDLSVSKNKLVAITVPDHCKSVTVHGNRLTAYHISPFVDHIDLRGNIISSDSLTGLSFDRVLSLGVVKLEYNLWVSKFIQYGPLVKHRQIKVRRSIIKSYFDQLYSAELFQTTLRKESRQMGVGSHGSKKTTSYLSQLHKNVVCDELIDRTYKLFVQVNESMNRKESLKAAAATISEYIMSKSYHTADNASNDSTEALQTSIARNIKNLYYQSLSIGLVYNLLNY